MNASGNSLVYSTFFGTGLNVEANGIAVDSSGNAYVTGFTDADDKLPARCFEPPIGGPLSDKSLDFEEMERAKRHYYQQMGWD